MLVVATDRAERIFFVEALEGAGYNIDQAATDNEVFNRVRAAQGRYDAVIFNTLAPEKSAEVLARRLRAGYADLPIVLARNEDEAELRTRFVEIGARH